MVMKTGEFWHCTNPNCRCEVFVKTAGESGTMKKTMCRLSFLVFNSFTRKSRFRFRPVPQRTEPCAIPSRAAARIAVANPFCCGEEGRYVRSAPSSSLRGPSRWFWEFTCFETRLGSPLEINPPPSLPQRSFWRVVSSRCSTCCDPCLKGVRQNRWIVPLPGFLQHRLFWNGVRSRPPCEKEVPSFLFSGSTWTLDASGREHKKYQARGIKGK